MEINKIEENKIIQRLPEDTLSEPASTQTPSIDLQANATVEDDLVE